MIVEHSPDPFVFYGPQCSRCSATQVDGIWSRHSCIPPDPPKEAHSCEKPCVHYRWLEMRRAFLEDDASKHRRVVESWRAVAERTAGQRRFIAIACGLGWAAALGLAGYVVFGGTP